MSKKAKKKHKPQMSRWRDQVAAIKTFQDFKDLLGGISMDIVHSPDDYNPNNLSCVLCCMQGAIGPCVTARQLRESAVNLLFALSWDGEELQI